MLDIEGINRKQLCEDLNRIFFVEHNFDRIESIEVLVTKEYDLVFNTINGGKLYGFLKRDDMCKLYIILRKEILNDPEGFEDKLVNIEIAKFNIIGDIELESIHTYYYPEDQSLLFDIRK